ncbi:MAG: hypothetical protein JWM80_562 [Cyanobacteria bacterium RYN_339]|nr:hypothetical protein [Cyanobacteria bacterium RYN_339]
MRGLAPGLILLALLQGGCSVAGSPLEPMPPGMRGVAVQLAQAPQFGHRKLALATLADNIDRYIVRIARTDADTPAGLRMNQQVVSRKSMLDGVPGVYFTGLEPGSYLIQVGVLSVAGDQLAREVCYSAPATSPLHVAPGHPNGNMLTGKFTIDAATPLPSALDLDIDIQLAVMP